MYHLVLAKSSGYQRDKILNNIPSLFGRETTCNSCISKAIPTNFVTLLLPIYLNFHEIPVVGYLVTANLRTLNLLNGNNFGAT